MQNASKKIGKLDIEKQIHYLILPLACPVHFFMRPFWDMRKSS